jgi:hypothetical protein
LQSYPKITRREMLLRSTWMVGSLSVAGYFAADAAPADDAPAPANAPKARAVINLFMNGGPSQMDSFDYKPRLNRDNGKALPMALPPVSNPIANITFGSPYRFTQHGQSGAWVSSLFPELAKCVDDMTIIRSMHHTQNDHSQATCFTSTGYERAGRPSLGAWILYALRSRNAELPGYVALNDGTPQDDSLSCGFLPPTCLATRLYDRTNPIADLQRREPNAAVQQSKLAFIRQMNRLETERVGDTSLTRAADACREQAVAMQRSIPDLYNLQDESPATLALYGIDNPVTQNLGTQCLIARRLIERSVRFVQLTQSNWDHHAGLLANFPQRAGESDRPIAGLLRDLKARGLLDETLVLWGGEFGRTPHGVDGREHNPYGYTVFLAGGGIRRGLAYGATDEFGYHAVEDKVSVHDLHATILHLLGLDHTRLVYRFGGRDFRLTDVEGEIVQDILA